MIFCPKGKNFTIFLPDREKFNDFLTFFLKKSLMWENVIYVIFNNELVVFCRFFSQKQRQRQKRQKKSDKRQTTKRQTATTLIPIPKKRRSKSSKKVTL
jgi:hypothetical protein